MIENPKPIMVYISTTYNVRIEEGSTGIEAGFKVLHPEEAEASGELDDDALDAVAGGTTYNKKGYAVVTMNLKCIAPGQPYAKSPIPAHPLTLDGKRCGTCIHMVTMDGMEVCPLTIDPAIANRK
jgi:hypothetical protein